MCVSISIRRVNGHLFQRLPGLDSPPHGMYIVYGCGGESAYANVCICDD